MRDQQEYRLQCWVVGLLRATALPGIVWFAVPNGEYRTIATGARLKRSGTIPGVADLVFILPGARAAFLELKRPKGRLSDEQKTFKARVEALGSYYEIAETGDEAIGVLRAWGVLRAEVRAAA